MRVEAGATVGCYTAGFEDGGRGCKSWEKGSLQKLEVVFPWSFQKGHNHTETLILPVLDFWLQICKMIICVVLTTKSTVICYSSNMELKHKAYLRCSLWQTPLLGYLMTIPNTLLSWLFPKCFTPSLPCTQGWSCDIVSPLISGFGNTLWECDG